MRVLLAYPYKADAYLKVGFVVPPMGVSYVASALKADGHDVEVWDFNVRTERPHYAEFDVVGVSMDTSRFKSGLSIAREAKEAGCTVVAGGPHVSFMDSEALLSGQVDYVVRGEGERTAVELLRAVQGGGDHAHVDGISYLADGAVQRTGDRAFEQDLDSLRPARELLDMDLYRTLEMGRRKVSPVVTSRGCPYGCSFCCSSELSGRRWRAMSPRRVVDEVEEVAGRYGFGAVAFLDDNFTMDPERVMEICGGILARRLDVYWWCFSRADALVKNREMVSMMARAGCRYVFIGFESARQDTLDGYRKGSRGIDARGLVSMLASRGISTHASFIIGGVDETREMVMETIRFAKAINPMAAQFSILTPYPGTRLFDALQERITTRDWDLYDCLNPVFRCDRLGHGERKSLLKKAYLSFYLSPRKVASGLVSGLRGRGIRLGSIYRIIRGTA